MTAALHDRGRSSEGIEKDKHREDNMNNKDSASSKDSKSRNRG
jgi:hypothetical protein